MSAGTVGDTTAGGHARWAGRRHSERVLRRAGVRGERAGLLVAALLLALALGVVGWRLTSSGEGHERAAGARALPLRRESLRSAPASLRETVDRALDRALRVRAQSAGTFTADDAREGLAARFQAGGASIATRGARLDLGPAQISLDGRSLAPAGLTGRASGDQVRYAGPAWTEWFLNTGRGLEQGFTIERPTARTGRALTVSLPFGGLRARLDAHGGSVLLQRAGRTLLRYGKLSASDARGHALRGSVSVSRGRLLLHVDVAGAVYPVRIDPLIQGQVLTLPPSPDQDESDLGSSVALSANGEVALVGDMYGGLFQEYGRGSYSKEIQDEPSGAAYVFVRSGGKWVEQAELTEEEVGFATSIGLSAEGTTAVVGYGKDQEGAGVGIVYERSGSRWLQTAKLSEGESLISRAVMSGNGDTVLLSDYGEEVIAYTRSGTTWSRQGTLPKPGDTLDFGASLAVSGDGSTALVANIREPGPYKGSVYVFIRTGNTWSEQGEGLLPAELEPQKSVENEWFETALSENGNTALLAWPNQNAAWIFTRSGETWSQQGKALTAAGATEFGWSVALSASGNTALIGAPGTSSGAGAVYVFTRSGSTWNEPGEGITASGLSAEAGLGDSVALSSSGETALVGAPGDLQGQSAQGAAVTLLTPPVVTTGAASEVSTSGAVAGGIANPSGGEAFEKCRVEYGLTTSYGSSKACSSPSGSGETPVAVSASLSGLASDTTYHFRVVAETKTGAHYGADATFTTLTAISSGAGSARVEELTATASGGSGTIAAGTYGSDIGGPPLFTSTEKYVDVYRSTSASYTKVEISDCAVGSARKLYWFDPLRGWALVSEQTYTAGAPACISATIDSTTSPSISQLTGTRFGFGEGPGAAVYGKCVATKDAVYTESACGTVAEKKGVPDHKGKYEWRPAGPGVCFTQKDGKYANAGCTQAAAEKKGVSKGKYEAASSAVTLTTGSVKLEASGVGTIECSAGSGSGTQAAPQLGTVSLALTGCKHEAASCATSGQSGGTIQTESLELTSYENVAKVYLGLSAQQIARFTCGDATYTLTGGASGEAGGDIDVMSTKRELSLKPGAGEQLLKITAGTEEEPATITATITQTTTQPNETDTKITG